MSIQDLTFDDADSAPAEQQDRLERYKGTEGCTDRLAIIFFKLGADDKPDITKPRLLKGVIRFHSKLGSVLVDPKVDPAVWAEFEEPREKAVTLVIKYPTDPKGTLIKTRLAEMKTMQWEFGSPTLQALKQISDGLTSAGKSLGAVDLMVECKSARYQRFEIRATETAVWRTNAAYAAKYLERALPLYQQVRLGRELGEAQIKEALGLAAPAPDMQVDDESIDDLLRLV